MYIIVPSGLKKRPVGPVSSIATVVTWLNEAEVTFHEKPSGVLAIACVELFEKTNASVALILPITLRVWNGVAVPIPTLPVPSITNGVVSLAASFTRNESPVPVLVTFSPSVAPLAASSSNEDGKLVPIPINPESSIIIRSTPAVSKRILSSSDDSSTWIRVSESSSTTFVLALPIAVHPDDSRIYITPFVESTAISPIAVLVMVPSGFAFVLNI